MVLSRPSSARSGARCCSVANGRITLVGSPGSRPTSSEVRKVTTSTTTINSPSFLAITMTRSVRCRGVGRGRADGSLVDPDAEQRVTGGQARERRAPVGQVRAVDVVDVGGEADGP